MDVKSHGFVKELVLPEIALATVTVAQVSQKAAKVPRLAKVGDLTPERFAREYPQMCQYFRDLDAMTYPCSLTVRSCKDKSFGEPEFYGTIDLCTFLLPQWRFTLVPD